MGQALCEVFLGSKRSYYPHTRPEKIARVTGERDVEGCGRLWRTGQGISVGVSGSNKARSFLIFQQQAVIGF